MALAIASTANAQVGYAPDASPYRDKDWNRDWTFFAGQFTGQPDPVGVAPRSGPLAGVRWQMYLTGPLYLAIRLAGAAVERTEIDPSKRIDERTVGDETVPMALADAALEMSVTGHRTWHGFAPLLTGGVGIAADLRGRTDVGSYRFGAPFTMTFGAAMTWSPNATWGLRVDWSNYLYRIAYPSSYYVKTTEDPAPRVSGQAQTFWRRNNAILFGLEIRNFRR